MKRREKLIIKADSDNVCWSDLCVSIRTPPETDAQMYYWIGNSWSGLSYIMTLKNSELLIIPYQMVGLNTLFL